MRLEPGLKRALLWAALAAGWISLEHWSLGPYSQVPIHDNADITIPAWLALSNHFFSGAGRWMPGLASGVDRLANDLPLDQPALWLFAALPGWLAWSATAFLHSFLAAFGLHRLCADRLKLSEETAALAGAAGALYLAQAYVFKNAWGYALLPAVLWGLEDAAARPRGAFRRAAVWGAVYGLCSSAPLTLPFGLAAVPVWLWVRGRLDARSVGLFGIFAAAAVALRYPVFAAMWAEAPLSQRSFRSAADSAAPISLNLRMWAAFAPAAAIAAFGLNADRSDTALRRALIVLAACFLLPVAVQPLVASLGGRLGLLRAFNFERLAATAPMWAAVCAGLGLERLRGGSRRSALLVAAAILLAQSLPMKLAHAGDWLYQGSYTALFRAAWPKALPSLDGPEGPYRVATVPHGMYPAYAAAYGLESADGYVNLYPERYRRFWAEVVRPTIATDPAYRNSLLSFGNELYLYLGSVPADGSPLLFARGWRLDLLSLANVRFVVSRHPIFDENLREVRAGSPPERGSRAERLRGRLRRNFGLEDRTYVYENTGVLPRAFVAPRAVPVASSDEAYARLRAASARELRETVVVEGLQAALPAGAGGGAVRFVSYGPDRIELTLDGAGPGVLFISTPWTPRWRAEVDGAPAALLPAWGAFQAVPLQGPARRVVLSYR